jgi:hypothetical protein
VLFEYGNYSIVSVFLDRKRSKGFFDTDHDKGEKPTYQMPVWDTSMLGLEDPRQLFLAHGTNRISSVDLEVLVNLFGPLPHCCLTQLQVNVVSIGDKTQRKNERRTMRLR